MRAPWKLNTPPLPTNGLATRLLHTIDASMWARDVLHVDPDPWQAEIINARGEQRLILASRQSGKSWTTAVRATHEALFHAPAMVLVASPSESQSKELFRKITGFLGDIPDAPKATRRNETELELDNGSRLVAVPGSERTIRSKSAVTLLIIDEASRIEDALISAVTPMLATTDGDLIALTTPFGRRGWFYEQWSSGEGYERTTKTAADCPRITEAFLAKERKRLGPMMYDQEYNCSFVDADTSVFSSELIEAALVDDFEPFLPVAA
jgi:Terminase large subunit, T4likevirus-type, N-terminal